MEHPRRTCITAHSLRCYLVDLSRGGEEEVGVVAALGFFACGVDAECLQRLQGGVLLLLAGEASLGICASLLLLGDEPVLAQHIRDRRGGVLARHEGGDKGLGLVPGTDSSRSKVRAVMEPTPPVIVMRSTSPTAAASSGLGSLFSRFSAHPSSSSLTSRAYPLALLARSRPNTRTGCGRSRSA